MTTENKTIEPEVLSKLKKLGENIEEFDENLSNYYAEYSRSYIVKGQIIPKDKEDWWD